MKHYITFLVPVTSALLALASSSFIHAEEEKCDGDKLWLHATSSQIASLLDSTPPKHPGLDCPFYQAAWRVFLYATEPVEVRRTNLGNLRYAPRFLVEGDFVSDSVALDRTGPSGPVARTHLLASSGEAKQYRLKLSPQLIRRPNRSKHDVPPIPAGTNQAKVIVPVIDENGRPLYYAIHINKPMNDFIWKRVFGTATSLEDKINAIVKADEKLEWGQEEGQGMIEIKSAWQEIEDDDNPPKNYWVTDAQVPLLKSVVDAAGRKTLEIDPDQPAREVKVALVAIHVVFTLKDHPEFVWSTFEHIDGSGNPDVAPSATAYPFDKDGNLVIPPGNPQTPAGAYTLYPPGTAFGQCNHAPDISLFDAGSQTFLNNGKPVSSAIYRVFPSSKKSPDLNVEIDPSITAINASMRNVIFPQGDKKDPRKNYQLVGAVWLDDPRRNDGKAFDKDQTFDNEDNQTTDTPQALVAGEDRMSSTAMESFTQLDNPSCFSCHDTNDVSLRGKRPALSSLDSKRLNVSHILSRFLETH